MKNVSFDSKFFVVEFNPPKIYEKNKVLSV